MKNVSHKISMFQGLGQVMECVKGSGRCATHNCRLVREIKKKKTRNLDKYGRVIWQMCEVTNSIPTVANPSRSAGTNKK